MLERPGATPHPGIRTAPCALARLSRAICSSSKAVFTSLAPQSTAARSTGWTAPWGSALTATSLPFRKRSTRGLSETSIFLVVPFSPTNFFTAPSLLSLMSATLISSTSLDRARSHAMTEPIIPAPMTAMFIAAVRARSSFNDLIRVKLQGPQEGI